MLVCRDASRGGRYAPEQLMRIEAGTFRGCEESIFRNGTAESMYSISKVISTRIISTRFWKSRTLLYVLGRKKPWFPSRAVMIHIHSNILQSYLSRNARKCTRPKSLSSSCSQVAIFIAFTIQAHLNFLKLVACYLP